MLVHIPQMQAPLNFSFFKSLFTLGNHVDYYPIRDLSYWIDVNILGGSETNTLAFKLMNFAYFYILLIFLFLILFELTKKRYLSLLATLTWAINPFHNEMLFWVSARKDLLFLTFLAICAFAFIKDYHLSHKTQKYFFLALVFFVLACLTKAAGVLTVLAWPIYYFISKQQNQYSKVKSFILILLSLFLVLLNKLNYSNNNSMYFEYSFEYRALAILAALGRAFLGYFFSYFNGLDMENWGEWKNLNNQFIIFGVLFLLISALYIIFLLKKDKKNFIFLILLFFVLSSIPGINPLHRNFYSTRYYELPFLILYVSFVVLFLKYTALTYKSRVIFFSLFLFYYMASHLYESPHWKNNLSITEKSLKVTPNNPALMKNYLVEYEMMRRWGRQSAEDEERATFIASKLLNTCKKQLFEPGRFLSGELCLNLWISRNEFVSFPDLNLITSSSKVYSEYAKNEFIRLTRLPIERVELNFLSIRDVLGSPEYKKTIFKQYIMANMSTENRRILYLALLCQSKERDELVKLVNYFISGYLITRDEINKILSDLSSQEYKEIKSCLLEISKKI